MTETQPIYQRNLFPLLAILFLEAIVSFSLYYRPPQSPASVFTSVLPPPPTLHAQAYLVKVIGERTSLLAQREWKKIPPASLTKLMTAVIASEELNPLEKIEISKEAKNVEPKVSKVRAGALLSEADIVRLMMIESANDAAMAVADAVGKARHIDAPEQRADFFRTLMNEKAKNLGMVDSSFENPVGFDGPHHVVSASDLAKLAEYIWFSHPEIWMLSTVPEEIVYTSTGGQYTIKNTNELVSKFPAVMGSKTGFTDQARGSLVMLYPLRPDKIAVIIILKSEDRLGDGEKIIKWLEGISA